MAKSIINRGSSANDGTGDNLRAGAQKVNDNFNELYTALGDGTNLTAGNYITDSSTSTLTNKSISGSSNTFTNIPSSAFSSLPNSKLDNSTVSITGDTGTHAVDLGDTITFEGGSGITTTVTADKVSFATDGSIVTETSTDTLTNKTISGSTNTLSSIDNTSLTNSTVSYGGVQLSLGGVDATPAFDLADATNYPTSSLSGTITNAQLAGSISNDKLVNKKITIGDDTSTNFDVNLGDSFEIIGGSGVSTAITNNRIELSVSAVPNTSLANSSITIGGSSVALGGTLSTTSNLNLTGTSSLSGTGTVDLTGAGSKIRFDFAGFGSLPTASTYVGMYAYDSTGNRPYYSSGSGWVRVLDENSSVSAHTDVNITGVSDGDVLTFSSAQGRFNAVAPSGGSSLTIEEEGSALSTAATTLDFVGKTITASGSGAEKTIDVRPTTTILDVNYDGSSAYRFTSHYGTNNNPTIYTKQGQTIAFNLSALAGSHPFALQTISGAYSSGNRVSDGLTHVASDGTVTTGVSANGKTNGVLYWDVPHDSATVYYVCTSHGAMNGTLEVAKKEGGKLLQQVNTQTGAVATGTTIFPEDDSIPQNTEGDEYMTLSITPKSATSVINIEAHVFYSNTNSTRAGTGLFKDSDADALAFTSNFVDDLTSMSNMQVFYSETSGNTTARTYKIRCGNIQTAGTFTFNGQGGNRKFGGTVLSTIRILEIEA